MKNIFKVIGLSIITLSFSSASFSQVNQHNNGNISKNVKPVDVGTGNLAETLWQNGEAQWINSIVKALGTDRESFDQFLTFNQTIWLKDHGEFFSSVTSGNISSDNAGLFFSNLSEKYTGLWNMEENNGKNVRRLLSPEPPSTQAVCNPSCYNINFQNGTLSGWNAYYAVAGSAGCVATITNQTGGACGAVTQAGGPNPNTGSSYHVQLLNTPGSDPIAGGLIPYTPPLGGYSTMVGDGPNNGFGVGVLDQTYMVDASSPILTIQYAVILENPPHTCYEQPWFRIEVLDQNGQPVPGCGQYFVYAGSGLPGFKSFYYAPGGDTVFARPWSTAFVPLYNYIGQCVTLRVTASDCAHGGHFGYGYVAATCAKLDLVASSAVFCTGQTSATIAGPPGAAAYQWSTSNGCISGSSTLQSVTITCAGKYNLITQSSAGVQCVDTFSIDIPSVPVGPPPVPCFTATRVCSGTPTTFDASCTTPSAGNKYYWDFYNTGHYDDSSGATPTWTFNSGGYYSVRLHVVTANGCGADTIINIPVDSTNNYAIPKATPTITNATACGQCNGKIALKITTTVKVTITASFCGGSATITPPGGISTGFTCGTGLTSSNGVWTITFSNICPGIYYLYLTPANAIPPTNCSPGGVIRDTVMVIVTAGNVNITSNITSSNASCGQSNGSASLTGIGGTGPYTFTWTSPNLGTGNSKAGLAPGTYTVVITDSAGCLGVSKVVISNFAQIAAQVTPFNVSCFGANDGAIKINPLAGVKPFTYLWSPNVSTLDSAVGLAPGSYTVLITDSSGCTGTVSATINQPTQVIATITDSVTQVLCSQTGSATVAAIGGYSPYTYKWTNGATTPIVTGLAIGTHFVTVTDAFGCTGITKVSVVCATAPKAVFISSDTTFCNEGGQCIDFFDQSTGSPTSWQWTFQGAIPDTSTMQNPTSICYYAPGSYIVKLVIGSASGMDSMTVSPLIIFAVGGAPPIITLSANGDTLFCDPQASYQWYLNGLPIAGATNSFYVPVQDGIYNVYITDFNECSRLGNGITWTSINETIKEAQIEIYPNPAGSQFTVYGLQFAVAAKLILYNAIGESVYSLQLETVNGKQQIVVDVSSLANGIYTLRILSGNESITKKVIVVHK